MDPQKQKQLVSQLFESTAKSQEEIDKMTPEEKREYLRGRLKQRMFFNGVSRQSSQQKKKMQDKMQESTNKNDQENNSNEGVNVSKSSEKNKKKKLRKKAKSAALNEMLERVNDKSIENSIDQKNEDNDDIVIVKKESESDYESDEN
jgi:hypothetical protein